MINELGRNLKEVVGPNFDISSVLSGGTEEEKPQS
jgi:hypothetical protein